MTFLDKPATIGDVIAWIIAVPAFTATFVILPYLHMGVIPKFELMYAGMGKKPDGLAQLVFNNLTLFYVVIPVAAVILMACSLILMKNNIVRISVLSACNAILWAVIAAAFLSFVYLRLQINGGV